MTTDLARCTTVLVNVLSTGGGRAGFVTGRKGVVRAERGQTCAVGLCAGRSSSSTHRLPSAARLSSCFVRDSSGGHELILPVSAMLLEQGPSWFTPTSTTAIGAGGGVSGWRRQRWMAGDSTLVRHQSSVGAILSGDMFVFRNRSVRGQKIIFGIPTARSLREAVRKGLPLAGGRRVLHSPSGAADGTVGRARGNRRHGTPLHCSADRARCSRVMDDTALLELPDDLILLPPDRRARPNHCSRDESIQILTQDNQLLRHRLMVAAKQLRPSGRAALIPGNCCSSACWCPGLNFRQSHHRRGPVTQPFRATVNKDSIICRPLIEHDLDDRGLAPASGEQRRRIGQEKNSSWSTFHPTSWSWSTSGEYACKHRTRRLPKVRWPGLYRSGRKTPTTD